MNPIPRWLERLTPFKKALLKLQQITRAAHERELSALERLGLIHTFSFTYELAWMTLHDYLHYQGYTLIKDPQDTMRQAFHDGLIEEGEGWMDMIKSRNQTAHTYHEEVADKIVDKVMKHYVSLFEALVETLEKKKPSPTDHFAQFILS